MFSVYDNINMMMIPLLSWIEVKRNRVAIHIYTEN